VVGRDEACPCIRLRVSLLYLKSHLPFYTISIRVQRYEEAGTLQNKTFFILLLSGEKHRTKGRRMCQSVAFIQAASFDVTNVKLFVTCAKQKVSRW